MSKTGSPSDAAARGVDRRSLLTGGAVGLGLGGLLGAGGALGIGALRTSAPPAPHPVSAAEAGTEPSLGLGGELPGFGGESLPCHGAHQAGIATPVPAAHMRLVAYQLRPEVDRDGIGRMLRILTGDVEGLASGEGPLADPEPELAARPSRLTVTVGVGPELVDRIDSSKRPGWLAPLPAFSRDKLGNGFDGGDLLLMVQADDPMPIAHAARMMHRDLASFATMLWTQEGFRHARGSEADGRTMRNMMGQIDGTINPVPGSENFDSLVWLGSEAGPLEGGSAYVIRRIRLELDTWDRVDRPGRESTIGRRLADGSPLSAPEGESDEFTPVDFEAKDSIGFPIIPSTAHIRRAHATNDQEHIFRRAANYEYNGESGLLFGCFQRDPRTQFTPIQQRLDELDMLNEWVTHVGSGVFAMLPGFQPGGWLGEDLFA